jgi:cholesterol oxidase
MRRLYLPLSRRTFVKLGAASTAAALLPGLSGCDSVSTEEVENLIIGSGFGGSIAAYRLGLAGRSSVILERGRRWTVSTPGEDVFSNMGVGDNDNRSAWLADQQPLPGIPPSTRPFRPYTGVLEKIYGDGINIVCASAVGGGSVVYSGMMVQPPRALFEEVFPTGVSYDEMNDTYYPMVAGIMTPRATPLPDDLLELPEWTATRTFLEQGERAGYDVQRILCAFDWDLARAEARGDIPPQLIRGSYIFGLNSGAKATLDKSYLMMAEMSGMTEVRERHWVQRIAHENDRYRVEVDLIDTDGLVLEQKVFLADNLFVCAGSANTTGLLLRAKAEGGLPDLPASLGSGWGNNGQHILARRNVGVDTGAFQAGPACAMIFDFENRIAMENGPAPLGFEQQVLIGTGQGIPNERGRITWSSGEGRVSAEWDPNNDRDAAAAANAILDRLNTENGMGERYTIPGLDESITFHPLGGCVMGETTDLHGRVNGYPGLYVLDGALIPGCTPCSNPFWTISANAERCLATLIPEDFGGGT